MLHSVCEITCADRVRPQKTNRYLGTFSTTNAFAACPLRWQVNIVRFVINWVISGQHHHGLEQTTNARTFKLVLPSRRRWHPCHSVGPHAQLKQPIWKPSARLHVRADLPAMSDQSRESKQQKVVKKIAKNSAVHLHAFQDVRVFAAALDADVNPSVIRLSYFSMPFWRRTFEKTVERSNNFRSTAWLSCKACLSMVWFATPPL